MKTGTLLIVWLISICINTYGQNFSEIIIAKRIPGEIAGNEKVDIAFGPGSISQQKITNADKLTTRVYDHAYYQQKSKAQKINGLVLITGGSVMSFLGIRSGLDISNGYSFTKSSFHTNRNENTTSSRLALTGLVMMAGSIPYFIYSLKNKNIASLKLTCQKTSFGVSNKACKKVTGLTFSIPIGK